MQVKYKNFDRYPAWYDVPESGTVTRTTDVALSAEELEDNDVLSPFHHTVLKAGSVVRMRFFVRAVITAGPSIKRVPSGGFKAGDVILFNVSLSGPVTAANRAEGEGPELFRTSGSGSAANYGRRSSTRQPPPRDVSISLTGSGPGDNGAVTIPTEVELPADTGCHNCGFIQPGSWTFTDGGDVEIYRWYSAFGFVLQPTAKVDTRAPRLTNADTAGFKLVLSFSEPLDEDHVPGIAAFQVSGSVDDRLNGVSVDGREVTLELEELSKPGETWRVRYTPPASDALQDAAGTSWKGSPRRLRTTTGCPTSG